MNAPLQARLFQNFFFSAEAQRMLVKVFAHGFLHAQVKEKGEAIKARYSSRVGV